jgi:hypothetical protein
METFSINSVFGSVDVSILREVIRKKLRWTLKFVRAPMIEPIINSLNSIFQQDDFEDAQIGYDHGSYTVIIIEPNNISAMTIDDVKSWAYAGLDMSYDVV